MCGIAGVINYQKINSIDLRTVQQMNVIQQHRGPDDEGLFNDNYCALGHRRLAIIDLSRAGHQPFVSDDGRYQLVYNGEIYNYIELREELEKKGWAFKTKTDTEVLLKAYQEYGSECLLKFNGMFAFVIYDSRDQSLFLARDRIGIKPLYYLKKGSLFYFASELKAFKAVQDFKPEVNRQAVLDYFVFTRKDLGEQTFFKDIKRLPRANYAILDREGLKLKQWWDPHVFVRGENNDSPEVIQKRIEEILVSSVRLRMRSDVPVGSCLSGGLDSSIILGILYQKKMIPGEYSTYTASIADDALDEARYVDILNQRYPFKNYRTTPTGKGCFQHLREFAYAQDEPTITAAFYTQYEVMRLAKKNGAVVLLDGQGGDENFAGYPYLYGFYLRGKLKQGQYGKCFGNFLKNLGQKQYYLGYQIFLYKLFSDSMKNRVLRQRTSFLNEDFFNEHLSKSIFSNEFMNAENLNVSLAKHFAHKLEHLLHSEDRSSMAFSIEARVPYLDYRLIEYVLDINDDFKFKSGQIKHLQREAVGQYTIPEILNRRDKLGFNTPFDEWAQGEDWKTLSRDSFEDLKQTFPEMFDKKADLPKSAKDRWKIIQLSVWKDIFLS